MKPTKSLSVLFVSFLVACGGESTPQPNSSAQFTSEPAPQGAIPQASETPQTSGMLPSDAQQPTGTPPGGPGLSNDQMRTVGTFQHEPAAAPAPTLTDNQIAAVADAANAGEIEQAKIAQKRAKDARVKKFAAMMVAHHGEARQKQDKLLGKLKLAPEESADSAAVKAEGTQVVEQLKSADAGSFDASYIASQVDAHRKVLMKLDTQLIPSARNPELKASLEEFRPKVEAHLKEATEIQQALSTRGNTGKDASVRSNASAGQNSQ